MTTVVLVIHVMIVMALVAVVLMQRSDGGALGIGGGGAGGGLMSGRGAANALTRTTTILAAMFFTTSLGLAMFGEKPETVDDIATEITGDSLLTSPVDGQVTNDDLLESFGASDEDALSAPDASLLDDLTTDSDDASTGEDAPDESQPQ